MLVPIGIAAQNFRQNQFNEMLNWMIDRQNVELDCKITGKWMQSGEFFKGSGKVLKRFDGKIFPKDLYILLTEGDIGKEKLLKQCNEYLKLFGILKSDLISVSYSDLLLENLKQHK